MKFLFILLITFSLLEDATLSEGKWYSAEVRFSDWKNVGRVDYSTNAIVTDWYSQGHSKYFRQENMAEIVKRLDNGDTLTVGLDYYTLYPISGRFLNPVLLNDIAPIIANGGVVRFKTYKHGDTYLLERLN